ncbi:hypothetical protein [Acidaminococcus timonensis]|uniref:hypothetical protein n=1 Tax=Acidaminococcus timonensis TaxID=1871002 RepID=UPI003077FB5E
MIDLDLKQAADKAIALQPQKRVLPLLYQDQALFIKRKISNHRNAFAKNSVEAAFWCEVYKISTVNQYFPLAPEIVLLQDEYFVMKAVGKTLQGVAKEAPWADCRVKAFARTGEALARLHQMGLHHGRPALRDIAYDKEEDRITFLDWENEKRFVTADPRAIDLILFVHSCFRERWKDRTLLDAAMGAYCNSPIGREMVRQAQKLIREHGTAFAFCEKLRRFGWWDVNSLDDARRYIMERE